MKKLIDAINFAPGFGHTVDDWNGAVKQHFGPYVRRRSILTRNRESFRAELINLAGIEAVPEFSQLLVGILRTYRANIRIDKAAAFQFMVQCFEGTWRSDEHWMSLFMTHEPREPSCRLHDYTFRTFALLDSLLEGCYKLNLRVAFGFAARAQTGKFPSDIHERDFGKLVEFITGTYSSEARLLIEDPECHLPVNQWRNVAAHKSFSVINGSTIEISFGRGTPKSRRITVDALDRVVEWAKQCLATVRMANVIIFLEYMPELKTIGLPDVPLRLESCLVRLCHNLGVVGFKCTRYGEEGDVFALSVQDRLSRTPVSAILHASQVLDQVSAALEDDPTTRHQFKRAAIRLVDPNGIHIASALIKLEDALAWIQGRLSLKERVKRTTFEFEDQLQLRRDLAGLRDLRKL